MTYFDIILVFLISTLIIFTIISDIVSYNNDTPQVTSLIIVGILVTILILSLASSTYSYKQGQIDYYKGVIKYDPVVIKENDIIVDTTYILKNQHN